MRCCSDGEPASSAITPRTPDIAATSWPARVAAFMQWALPLTTLALVPKCPGCVAGYVLLLTGMGISFTAATAMRWSLIAVSVSALAYLAFRTARRAFILIMPHA